MTLPTDRMTEPRQTYLPIILRPSLDLDARDAAIVRAVVRAWDRYGGATYRDVVSGSGLAIETVHRRITAINRPKLYRGGFGLVARGWLCANPDTARTLRPGPRFGGISQKDGTIYELVGWDS